MSTFAIPAPKSPSTNLCDSALSTICHPFISAIETIREVHEYIESCSTITKLALTILAGAVVATICLPLNMAIGAIVVKCISLAIGREKYDAISSETPLYNGKIPSAFTACILCPLVEEIAFRGILQPTTKALVNFIVSPFFDKATAKKIAVIAAIVFTSLLFGALHFINSPNLLVSLPQVICASFSGIIFGLEREFGGGLLESTAHHMTNNTIAWVLIQALESAR